MVESHWAGRKSPAVKDISKDCFTRIFIDLTTEIIIRGPIQEKPLVVEFHWAGRKSPTVKDISKGCFGS